MKIVEKMIEEIRYWILIFYYWI